MPRLPADFGLYADTNERRAAVGHLRTLSAGDVVVHDRGCFSCEMLLAHVVRGRDAVFRLKRDANAETVAFLAGPLQETLVWIRPDDRALARLKARHPGAAFGPLKLRLVRYAAGDTVFALGTTLAAEDGFTVEDLAGICRARWRIDNFPSVYPYSVCRSVSDAILKSGIGLPSFSGLGVSRHLRMASNVSLAA